MHKMEEREEFSRRIQTMFSAIAPRYDLLNRTLSLGVDCYWRKRAISRLRQGPEGRYLDIATGTGDVALEYFQRSDWKPAQVCALDFSPNMLDRARVKIENRGLAGQIPLFCGAAEALPFRDRSFDGITVAFGVRNFADVEKGLHEMERVLKPGGRAVILEFSMPREKILETTYRYYFDHILPRIGRWVSGHPSAYSYLPQSVEQFPVREAFLDLMKSAGFDQVACRDLTFGIVTLYVGRKPVS